MNGMSDKNVQDYLQFMTDVAVIFGANITRAQTEMTEVLKFEEIMVTVCVHVLKIGIQAHILMKSPIFTSFRLYAMIVI